MQSILKAASVSVEAHWPKLFAQSASSFDAKKLISDMSEGIGAGKSRAMTNGCERGYIRNTYAGGGAAAAPAAAAASAPAAKEEKKEEKKQESESEDDDMGFGLFD